MNTEKGEQYLMGFMIAGAILGIIGFIGILLINFGL